MKHNKGTIRKIHLSLRQLLSALLLSLTSGYLVAQADRASNELTIITPDLPPYITRDLKPSEPFVVMLREILEPYGYKLKLEYYPLARAIDRSKQNMISARFPAWLIPEMQGMFAYSEPVLKSAFVLLAHKDLAINYKDPNPSKIYSLGGVPNRLPEQMSKLPAAFKPVNAGSTHDAVLAQLVRKRVDIWMTEEITGRYLLAKYYPNEVNNYFVTEDYRLPADFGLSINRKNPISVVLVNQFNEGLHKLKESGRYQELMKHPLKNQK